MDLLTAKEKVILLLTNKFNIEIKQKLKNLFKRRIGIVKIYKIIARLRKKPISVETIQLFYDEPKAFFENHSTLLNNTSYFDESGNSIFDHYFNVLYMQFTNKNNYLNNKIYTSNFNSFFKTYEKYLAMQDSSLETPFHKIAKLRKIKFFFLIYNQLKLIDALNEKILLIKNINDETCFDCIAKEIEIKRSEIINNKEDFELYNNFIAENDSLIKLLPKESQHYLYLFTSSINFDLKFFQTIEFNELYTGLFNLFQNTKERINEYFNPSINYLNCLFNFCKSNGDFDKTYKFILELSDQKLNEINKNKGCESISIHYYIYNHIGYVLRKMKIDNKSYVMKLIKDILPNLLSNDNFEEFKDKEINNRKIKIQFKINSLGNNLAKNPYLNFEQKYEIFYFLEKELKENFDEGTDEDVMYLYKLFKLYNKKIDNKKVITKSSITSYFKKYEFIRKIFADFFFIGKLYRSIYKLCYKYDKIKVKDYLEKLNNFLKNNRESIFSNYKYSYAMNNKNIEAILNIIILFEKQNYNTGVEEEYLERKIITFNNHNTNHFQKLYKKFILTETKLVFFTINEIILNSQRANKKVKKSLFIEFLDLFFSFKYDLNRLLNIKSFIPFFTNKNKDEFKIYENRLIENLPLIKGNPNEFTIYKFILKYSPFIKNIFIFHREITHFKVLMKKYLIQLVFKWEEECNFSELSEFINKNILLFSKIFIDIKDSLQNRKNKINFFFDEFIKGLNLEFKEELHKYKQLALDYTKNYQDDDNFYYELNSEIYISMMLIFIRLKFGKYNPQVLFTYITHYKKGDYVFLLFLNSYFKNDNKKDILYNFFLMDSNLLLQIPDNYKGYFQKSRDSFDYPENSWQEKILIFLLFSQSKLKEIEYSLIFDYIKLIISNNNLEKNNKSKNYFIKFFKYTFLGINQKQNKEIFELMVNSLFDTKNEIKLFCFLNLDPILYNEESIRHKIKTLKEFSLYLDNHNEIIKNDFFKEERNKKTKKNLVKFLKLLKQENDSFYNCIKNNRFLIKICLHFLLKSYYNDKFEESFKNPDILIYEDDESKIIKNEIFNFLDFYKVHSESQNEYMYDFSQIFFKIYEDNMRNSKFFNIFKNHIYQKIYSYNSRILYNYNSLNISFFKSLLEDILFLFLFFFCYIIDVKYNDSEAELIAKKQKKKLNN